MVLSICEGADFVMARTLSTINSRRFVPSAVPGPAAVALHLKKERAGAGRCAARV
jgi:hypothetical protein